MLNSSCPVQVVQRVVLEDRDNFIVASAYFAPIFLHTLKLKPQRAGRLGQKTCGLQYRLDFSQFCCRELQILQCAYRIIHMGNAAGTN